MLGYFGSEINSEEVFDIRNITEDDEYGLSESFVRYFNYKPWR
jgi:hypothetical protein